MRCAKLFASSTGPQTFTRKRWWLRGDSSITVSLRLWTKTSDYWDLMFMLNAEARDRLKAENIDIPFPQRVIRVVQEQQEPATQR